MSTLWLVVCTSTHSDYQAQIGDWTIAGPLNKD